MSRKAYFDAAAETWDCQYYSKDLVRWLKHVVSTWGLQCGDHVLDVGTGTGLLIPFIRQAIGPLGSITAIDYAEHMIQICRSKYAHIENVTIQCQDVENLELPLLSYDIVICFGVFPHLQHHEVALEQLHRVLKTEGTLIVAHALSRAEIHLRHKDTASVVSNDNLPTDYEMRRLLTHAGFTVTLLIDQPGYYLCTAIKS